MATANNVPTARLMVDALRLSTLRNRLRCRVDKARRSVSGTRHGGRARSIHQGSRDAARIWNCCRPVINVSWDDATAYAAWLAEQTGRPYRLPTEAEWEYAARAGTDSPFWTGACIHTDQANYDGNYDYNGCGAKTGVYRQQTLPVDSLAANPWGLHHVAGNVWEWTCSAYANPYDGKETVCIRKNDADAGPNRVIRGGAWNSQPAGLRSAYRGTFRPSGRFDALGFRLAQDL
ncbi:formylglycine-generating enzyme family protein [uncultured Lamprocystis sp.]|uniref:formylglycine-generating enzyme family protein n=2 Tax=uncultured Lamprocystis sp. TaxID=543132 RepID=UPI0025E3F054|nr:formylglycine-generating enzyme family protein [uncultured Lamprocystis sp.]